MSQVASRAFKEAMGKDWLEQHRNRFVVDYYDGAWAVFRIYSKSGVTLVLKFKHEELALEMTEKLNDMYEDGVIF